MMRHPAPRKRGAGELRPSFRFPIREPNPRPIQDPRTSDLPGPNDPPSHTRAQIAEHFAVSLAKVSQYVAMVIRFPEEFVEWLEGVEDPDPRARLSLRKLVANARAGDAAEQRREIAPLVKNVELLLPSV